MENYLLLNIFDKKINQKTLNSLVNYKNIHINIFSNKESILKDIMFNIDKKTHNIFLYSFSIEDVLIAKKYDIEYHYCFKYDNIIIDSEYFFSMVNDKKQELFIIFDDILFEPTILIDRLKKINRPVCFYTTGLLTGKINEFEKIRKTVSFINNEFYNPLFDIESNLEIEYFQKNYYLEQKNNIISISELVLGIHGDVIIDSLDLVNFSEINHKYLIKLKECVSCSFFNTCKNKGIGYTIKQLNLKGCNSYKIIYGKK